MRKAPRKRSECAPVDNGDGTASVPLYGGALAIIDSTDIERVAFLAWQHRIEPDGQHYALATIRSSGVSRVIRMHRLLLCFPLHQIDHIDGNGLNNRRSNLRFCDNSQNQWNCKKNKPGKYSRFKGVTRHCVGDFWKSQLMKDRKSVHAKYHKSEIEAARAYDAAAIRHFGEFAATNVKLGLLPSLQPQGATQ